MFNTTMGMNQAHDRKKKVTCTACALKKCIGRCHFEVVENPPRKKAA